MPDFPHYKQLDQMDCGPTCLRMISTYFGRHYTAQTLRERAQINKEGVSLLGIAEAAESIGMKAVGVRTTLAKLTDEMPLPCILHWGQSHFVVLYKIKTPDSLSRRFLASLRGGRKPDSGFPYPFPSSGNVTHAGGENGEAPASSPDDTLARTTFYIADPATGLVSLTSAEFQHKWLSTQTNGPRQGIALSIEPTSRFYEKEGEKAGEQGFVPMLKYLWQYKNLIVQLVLALLAGSGFSLLIPFLTQSVVDIGIGTGNISFVYLVLIAQLVLMLSVASIDFLRSWILLYISSRLNLSILSGFLSKLMRLPISFFEIKQFGDVIQRIGDHQRIEAFLTGQTLNVLFSLFNLVVFGAVLAYYHLTIFVVAIGASLVYVAWVVTFLKKRRQLDTHRFEVSSRNQSQIVQLVQGMQDIKLSGAETSKRWEWERTQAKLFKWSVKSLSLSQSQHAGALLINNGKNLLITFLAAKAVIDGQITLGAMMSIQYILGQFNAPVEQMMSFLQSWQDAQMSLERLNEVHQLADEEPLDTATLTQWNNAQDIVIRDLSFTYPGAGNLPVLRNISLTIPFGKTTAIVGTSGSGKTTLLKLLLRFHEPQGGGIYLRPPSASDAGMLGIAMISHRAWRQQCGVVMQEGFVFSDTIARNIAVSDEVIDEEKLHRAARTANIHGFIASLPLGYHTRIGAEGNGISQGQKQRILIARSVYKNPEILLFDEATNALDTRNEAVIVQNLNEFFQGRTVVVVAHRLSTVKNADQIIVMEKGEIAESGTHDELVALRGKYFELVSNQLGLAAG
nr:peptidase domain-containing ABC transporter [uncultured Dyadobacter sp.]